MPQTTIQLRSEHIALCDVLKLSGIAESGGQAKQLIAAGEATVDGKVERRKTAKIRANQVVRCGGQEVRVIAA